MEYVWLSGGFFLIHLGAYVVAGVLNQQLVSRDLHGRGLVYLQPRYTRWTVFWNVQSEAVVYSALFGGLAAWLLF